MQTPGEDAGWKSTPHPRASVGSLDAGSRGWAARLLVLRGWLHAPQVGCFPTALSSLANLWIAPNGQTAVKH